MTLALFDFDGTISTKDSLLHFTAFVKGRFVFFIGICCLTPILILQKIGLLGSQKTKDLYMSWFFKNMTEADFKQAAKNYVDQKISEIIIPSAVEKINWHLQNGHRVIVVSASPEDYLKPWCDGLNIACIATKLKKQDGKLTGRIEGRNCKGEEKVRRIKAEVLIAGYTEIFGYGNSSGDREMLALCTKPFYKLFQ